MTSESNYGIMRQLSNTCPMIDAVIVEVRYSDYSCTVTNMMENIRTHVSDIREWGQEWKELAIDKDKEVRNLEEENDELQNKLAKLQEAEIDFQRKRAELLCEIDNLESKVSDLQIQLDDQLHGLHGHVPIGS